MAYYGTIVGKRNPTENLQGELHKYKTEYIIIPSGEDYEGEYEATPTDFEQVFPTNDKHMTSDFTVHKTPYSEVSNIYGGYTVTIL